MARKIDHRGPDEEGYFVDRPIAMASRRLSIIDLACGTQPIANEDDTIHIVFNGEIYNYAELQSQLKHLGHRFRTESDTEVIVHLYEQYGTKCVDKLNGMFAFAIWDQPRQRLFLARDPLGQKPLYYTLNRGDFVFASEIKSLFSCDGISARLNPTALHDCLSLRCIPGRGTLFANIEKLPAGHTLIFENGKTSLDCYWDLAYTPKVQLAPRQIEQRLSELLQETVDSHMVSDVPVGAFLSGGIDSSMVVAMMTRHSPTPVKTFSVGVREASFNELPYARALAQAYNTDHHEAQVRPDLIAALPEMIYYMEEPVDPFAFGVYSVAELASRHVKVVLGGDGGDEMFGGYDRYVGNRLVDVYCALPQTVRRRIIEPAIARLADSYEYNSRVQKLRWLAAMSHTTGGRRYAESACFLRFNHERKQQVYGDALWRAVGPADSADQLVRYFDAENATDLIDRMLYTDVKTRLAEHLLMVADRMTMAHSVECRSPFVDRRVAEFVARIPADLKIRGRRLKYIQRRVARPLLPDILVKRRKQGFSFPLAHWFKNELRDTTFNLLKDGNLAAEGLFRPEGMLAMLDEHVRGKCDHNYRLWLLLNVELWHRLFIEKRPRDQIAGLLNDSLASRQTVLT